MIASNYDDEEPRGKYFYEQPDLYCSYCQGLIEPEFLDESPCHLCGEFGWLYEKPLTSSPK